MLYLILISFGVVGFSYYSNIKREKFTIKTIELTPNCLMTNSPLVFVTGKRSLFYFKSYWNTIPQYLSNHGYDVYVLELPWRTHQFTELTKNLNSFFSIQKSCHLIYDSSISEIIIQNLGQLNGQFQKKIKSLNEIRINQKEPLIPQSIHTQDLSPHSIPRNYFLFNLEDSKNLSLKDFIQYRICFKLHKLLTPTTPPAEILGVPQLSFLVLQSYLKNVIKLAEGEFNG